MIDLSRRDTLGLTAVGAVGAAGALSGDVAVATRPAVSVAAFGAKGDGRADDTAAFQSALDTGLDVVVPASAAPYRLTRTLATRRDGQRLHGAGAASVLRQEGAGADATVLAVTHDACVIADLSLVPGTNVRALNEGWGVAVVEARQVVVAGCRFEGMRRGGVLLSGASQGTVRDNFFTASVVRADGQATQAEMGYDILLAGAASHNLVTGNRCESGCGTGIGCQTGSDGLVQSDNVIAGNIVREHPCYGIMAYLSGTRGEVRGLTVSDNAIEAISGTVRTPDGATFYGAGIYLQTVDDFVVSGNRLRGTNRDRRRSFSGGAVPAAIAVSGAGNGAITGNLVRDCVDGIASIQATRPAAAGEGTVITGNVIVACARIGINLSDCAAATVSGNRLAGQGAAAAHGIFVLRASARATLSDFIVSANTVDGFHAGIEVEGSGIARATIVHNTILRNRGYAISCAAATSVISGNIVDGALGIALSPLARRGLCRDNVITAPGAALIDDAGSGVATRDNIVPEGEAAISTALALGPAKAVGGKRWVALPAGAVVRDLGSGFEGQERGLLATQGARLVHGAIILRGGADRTLAAGELANFVRLAGRWRETG